jgi:hypothetical protein
MKSAKFDREVVDNSIIQAVISNMSKRARTDEPLRPIPTWLAKSGVDASALRQLMAWMDDEDVCFFPCAELADRTHDAKRFRHPVEPYIAVQTFDCLIYCEKCAKRCQCCEEINTDMSDPKLLDNPHDLVCGACARRTCDHAEDADAWPAYCEGCERGCREPETCTIGGEEKGICERCSD